MKEELKLYIERIRDDSELIQEELDPSFMDIKEKDVRFEKPIVVTGEAYVTDDWLIVRLSIKTEGKLVCALCNEPFIFPVDIEEMVENEPLEQVKDGVFDLLPLIRESILLAIPFYPQCGMTECNNRTVIEPYLKKERSPEENSPFKDL